MKNLVNTNQDLIHIEKVSAKRKYWLRISRTCNNKCMFCLDSNNQDGTFKDTNKVKEIIKSISNKNYERIVISGGEASIHPDFIDIVSYAKKCGFTHIQTITNGRMFSKMKFVERAKESGLTEITFSIHGHTKEIHDYLTSVPGSFNQAIKGLVNALKLNLIVNVDIVINKVNVPYLYDIVKFFINLGVYEFDLLYLSPFGRAYDKYFDELSFNLEDYSSVIKKTLNLGSSTLIKLWTNRLPPEALIGNEKYIQDPQKMHDEINGRLREFEKAIAKGEMLVCAGDRCSYCFVKRLCYAVHDIVSSYKNPVREIEIQIHSQKRFENLLESEIFLSKWMDHIARYTFFVSKKMADYILHNKLASRISEIYKDRKIIIEYQLPSSTEIDTIRKLLDYGKDCQSVFYFYDISMIKDIKKYPDKIKIQLNKKNIHWILENPSFFENEIAGTSSFKLHLYSNVSVLKNKLSDFKELLKKYPDVPVENAPLCFGDQGFFENYIIINDVILDKNNEAILTKMVNPFIRNNYFVQPDICKKCDKLNKCKGMHINYIRILGYEYFMSL